MVFLTGPHCCGKTHILRYLYEYGFPSIDLGPTIRKIYSDFSFGLTFPQWVMTGEDSYGEHFTDKLILLSIEEWMNEQRLKEGKIQDFIISGNRSLPGIQYLQQYLQSESENNFIIYVDAETDLLKQRYESREGKSVSYSEFQAYLDKDNVMGLPGIKDASDSILLNNGGQNELTEKINSLFFSKLGYESKVMLRKEEGIISLENEYRTFSKQYGKERL